MAIEIRAGRTDITDVALNAINPAVQARDLVVLRRHDTEAPNTDLLLALAFLVPGNNAIRTINTGSMRLAFSNRGIGGRPETVVTTNLSPQQGAANTPSVGALLASTSAAELNTTGRTPAIAQGIVGDALPASLTLATLISTYSRGHQIDIAAAGSWVWWAGVYGQNMSDAFDQLWTWIPA